MDLDTEPNDISISVDNIIRGKRNRIQAPSASQVAIATAQVAATPPPEEKDFEEASDAGSD